MNTELTKKWKENLEILDVAFQPILNINTGETYAVEALLRNYQDIGFKYIFELFDTVFKENILYSFDLALREKAFKKYTKIATHENIKLFYNLDNRLFSMSNFSNGNATKLLKKLNIKQENICFEISERHEISQEYKLETILQHYKNENFCIAIDDFGIGYSGYKLFYESTPNLIKIDRFFLQNIEKDLKKKIMLRSITQLAIQLGIKVIAEGVETREELLTCKEIGCHLVQGYLIQRPTKNTNEILQEYAHIVKIIQSDKRVALTNKKIEQYIEKIEALPLTTKMANVIEYFKNTYTLLVPVIDSNNETVGILQEAKIKEFLYSPFGISLLSNKDSKKTKLKHLLDYCGTADINSNISTIIEIFSNNPESTGIIITKKSKYYGFLSARSIISIMNEESLLLAQDQNPLTKLPGNNTIQEYIHQSTKNQSNTLLCYFDLDNFKAFNDVYGFRNGDRVIQLFADIIRKHLPQKFLKAHIGGDDFFVGLQKDKDLNIDDYLSEISKIIYKFSQSAKEFYSKKDKELGYIISKDREGNSKLFPLLTVSVSILEVHANSSNKTIEIINNILTVQKKTAKTNPNHIAISTLI